MILVAVGIVVAVFVVRSCQGGERLSGNGVQWVESIEDIEVEEILELPELADDLASADPPMTPGEFINLNCAQLIHTDVGHRISAFGAECTAVLTPHTLGFDLVLSYTDGSCRYPPTIEVTAIQGLLHFTIDKTRDRGGCDDMRLFLAKGIRLVDPAGADGQGVAR
ncbi:hypothetical protein [Candidatus Poriferisocius sp.]|uniref:hypothetical protein n=1 Tax=Candidatus Poriferisocius sp. TaxID=3101276 RepID=UPI003B59774A